MPTPLSMKKEVSTNTFTCSQKISFETIASLLCSAFEGGSNYWYQIQESIPPEKMNFRTDKKRVYPYIDYPLNPGGHVVISSLEEPRKKHQILDLAAIEKGIKLMAENQPTHFADVIAENADATTGDVFLQLCLYGEVLYG